MEAEMERSTGFGEIVDGFLRGGAWGAALGVFVAMVEVAPLFLR
jgi:hypothetical protein